ncbi:ComEC/Rec2 family competence protein [Acidicapsa ligni]|uniref:ComEC/Rec2 family competence protein n=1 Tax=Acidicapsa ligni TaxID=542300 RepID=UPI0021DFD2A8|nr:MBL fold metallo-hydrolase [Acidicapsa ligni]
MAVAFVGALASAQAQSQGNAKPDAHKLRIYFMDVEGGQSTLFITPAGQSLLVDTGWPGSNGRDADRIVAAAKQAGISKIDYVMFTHYHVDHVGGLPQLAERIPIGTFIDHGPNREMDKGVTEAGYAAYQKILATGKYKNIHLKPGDVLPVKGITATVISSDGNLIANPLPGAGEANSYCQQSEVRPADQTENARSLGIEINFGKLKLIDLGDLTWDKEMQLMCPANKLGHIDVYIVSHHGWNQSSSPALVDAIHSRVAIMDNGADKGGSTPTLQTIRSAPGLETLWQIHYSNEGGEANNTDAEYIANPKGPDAGYGLELVASPDGSFDVINARTQKTKHYEAKSN